MVRKTPEPLQVRHGTTAQAEATVGAPAELGADLQKKHIILYDGEKEGGYPAARADRKVSSATEGLTVNGEEEATLAGDIELKDSRQWLKRVDELLEDTTALLADVPVGGAIVTPDAEPMQFPYEYPGPYNDSLVITESGEWVAPVTAIYDILAIDGGSGGRVMNNTSAGAYWRGGENGVWKRAFRKYNAGDSVNVTIGAGGIGQVSSTGSINQELAQGGVTAFGDSSDMLVVFPKFAVSGAYAGNINFDSYFTGVFGESGFYGAGGGGQCSGGAGSLNAAASAGNGQPGAVYLFFFNPNKPH